MYIFTIGKKAKAALKRKNISIGRQILSGQKTPSKEKIPEC
jgi:hypothetical protein